MNLISCLLLAAGVFSAVVAFASDLPSLSDSVEDLVQELKVAAQAAIKQRETLRGNINSLQQKKQTLRLDLSVAKDCHDKLKAEILRLQAERQSFLAAPAGGDRRPELLERKSQVFETRQRLVMAIADSRLNRDNLKGQEKSLREEIAAIQKRSGGANAEPQRLATPEDRLRNDIRLSSLRRESLENDLRSAVSRSQKLEEAKEDMLSTQAGLQEAKELFGPKGMNPEARRQTRREILANLERVNGQLNGKRDRLQELVELLQERKSAVGKSPEVQEDPLRELVDMVSALQERQTALRDELSATRQEKDSWKQQLAALSEPVDSLERKYLDSWVEHYRSQRQSNLEGSRQRQREFIRDLALKEASTQKLFGQVDGLKSQRDNSEKEVEKWNSQFEEVKKQKSTVPLRNQEARNLKMKRLDELNLEVDALKAQQEELHGLLESVKSMFGASQLEATQLAIDEKKFRENIDVLKGENVQLAQEAERLKSTLSAVQSGKLDPLRLGERQVLKDQKKRSR